MGAGEEEVPLVANRCPSVAPHSEPEVPLLAEKRFSWACRPSSAAALACAVLLVIAVTVRVINPASPTVARNTYADLEAAFEDGDIEVVPPRENCSRIGESCRQTKCCRMSGYACFEKDARFAGCLKDCIPGQPNGDRATNAPKVQPSLPEKVGVPPPHAEPFFRPAPPGPWSCSRPTSMRNLKPALSPPATTLFCFSVALTDYGDGKKSWDLDLVRTQAHTKTSVFGCEDWIIFSDVKTWLSPGQPAPSGLSAKLWTVRIDFPKVAHRPNTKHWVNTPLFVNAWNAIRAQGRYLLQEWTVKADVATVFFPSRLRVILNRQRVTSSGVYLENCKYVRYGLHGSLEVMSKRAAQTLAQHAVGCLAELPWTNASHAHFRYFGEDKFAERCMDRHGVDRVPSNYEVGKMPSSQAVLTTITCPAHEPKAGKVKGKWHPDCATVKSAALHAFRKPKGYFRCLEVAQTSEETVL